MLPFYLWRYLLLVVRCVYLRQHKENFCFLIHFINLQLFIEYLWPLIVKVIIEQWSLMSLCCSYGIVLEVLLEFFLFCSLERHRYSGATWATHSLDFQENFRTLQIAKVLWPLFSYLIFLQVVSLCCLLDPASTAFRKVTSISIYPSPVHHI